MAQWAKNPPAMQETLDPWVGKILWKRERLPIPVFLPGEFHGQRSLAGYSPRVTAESDRTKHTIEPPHSSRTNRILLPM